VQQAQAAAPRPLTAEQKQQVAREAMREVIKPEVVEKLAMLLMVVSQEERERRRQLAGEEAAAVAAAAGGASPFAAAAAAGAAAMDEAAAMEVDGQQQLQQQQQAMEQQQQPGGKLEGMDLDLYAAAGEAGAEHASPTAAAAAVAAAANGVSPAAAAADGGGAEGEEGMYEAQERLVMTEFRDTLLVSSCHGCLPCAVGCMRGLSVEMDACGPGWKPHCTTLLAHMFSALPCLALSADDLSCGGRQGGQASEAGAAAAAAPRLCGSAAADAANGGGGGSGGWQQRRFRGGAGLSCGAASAEARCVEGGEP
jgi:hypothetical protein